MSRHLCNKCGRSMDYPDDHSTTAGCLTPYPITVEYPFSMPDAEFRKLHHAERTEDARRLSRYDEAIRLLELWEDHWSEGVTPPGVETQRFLRKAKNLDSHTEEAMTDLREEARKAAEAAYPPGSGRLGGKLFNGSPAKEGFRERSWFERGYLAGSEQREKRTAKLRAELDNWRESARKAVEESCGDEVHCTCVGLLRKRIAELEEWKSTVPIEDLKELNEWELGFEYPCEAAASISDWLSGQIPLPERKA